MMKTKNTQNIGNLYNKLWHISNPDEVLVDAIQFECNDYELAPMQIQCANVEMIRSWSSLNPLKIATPETVPCCAPRLDSH